MNRRQFIRLSGGLVGSVVASSALGQLQFTADQNKKVGYAVVGLGFFSGYVIPRIQESDHSRVTALVSSDKTKALEWAAKYGIPAKHIFTYEEFDKLARLKEVDAVYIATPVGTHCEFAIEALNAGKHVIVEKTMAATVAEAKKMTVLAEQKGKKLMVAYRARYEPFNQLAAQLAKENSFGKVSSVMAHKGFYIGAQLGKNNWRINKTLAGGGALLDIGIYSIQAIRCIAGTEPLSVMAMSYSTPGDQRFKEVEEHLTFLLRFPNGILASGSASWGYALQNYYRVVAENNSYELDPASSNGNLQLKVHKATEQELPVLTNVDQIKSQFAHFSHCILQQSQPETDGYEGIKDLAVVEAIYQSARTGQEVAVERWPVA
jgi:predicted dehydrogenase